MVSVRVSANVHVVPLTVAAPNSVGPSYTRAASPFAHAALGVPLTPGQVSSVVLPVGKVPVTMPTSSEMPVTSAVVDEAVKSTVAV